MNIYEKWLVKRRLREENGFEKEAAAQFLSNQEDEVISDDQEKIRQELFTLVCNKYPGETMQFLDGMAQRGDEEINNLMSKIRGGNLSSKVKEPKHPSEKPVVVPPLADSGSGEGESE